jgi:lysozyme family protein
MADFLVAYENMMLDEGGYVLHNVPGDRGGMTYAGIARKMNPNWPGWAHIDRNETPPSDLVRQFYREGYWKPLMGDLIKSQRVASNLFNFAVNTSAPGRPTVAVKLAQIVVGATPDGVFGPKTLQLISAMDEDKFILAYTLAKITRYRDIVAKDKTQLKFLMGWLNRSLKGAA